MKLSTKALFKSYKNCNYYLSCLLDIKSDTITEYHSFMIDEISFDYGFHFLTLLLGRLAVDFGYRLKLAWLGHI